MEVTVNVFEMIEAQQKGKENTAVWMVGEQLKDICRREPECGQILAEDLQSEDMSLAAAERKIKAYADKHRTGNCAVVPPNVAEDILRQFYGLPKGGGAVLQLVTPKMAQEETDDGFSLDDFLD